jgi:P-type Mg2+ transporter
VVTVGALLPATPLAPTLGFSPLPGAFYAALVGMVIAYLALIEFGKLVFYRTARITTPTPRRYSRTRHLIRRAARFSTAQGPHQPQPDHI